MSDPLRFSRLRLMGQSPAHFINADRIETSAMQTGTAADALIFGTAPVLVYPGAVRRGKEWESWRDGQDPGAHIVTKSEYESAAGIALAVRGHREAMEYLDGERQQTMFWTFDGVPCRGTPDVRGESKGRRRLVELKTGETSDPRRFHHKARRFAYHAALAWSEAGHALAGRGTIHDSYIVAVEQAAPYVVTIFHVTPETIELGARIWRTWFEQLKNCEASGVWPGYSDSVVELEMVDDDIEIGDAE